MVLGPVSCHAEVHCTTFFALRSGKFSRVGGVSHPHTYLKFRPCSEGHLQDLKGLGALSTSHNPNLHLTRYCTSVRLSRTSTEDMHWTYSRRKKDCFSVVIFAEVALFRSKTYHNRGSTYYNNLT